MHPNTAILEKLVQEDFALTGKPSSRWASSEEHDSLVIDRNRGIFFWNSQEIVGDPLTYLTRIRRMPISDAREYLRQFKNYQGSFVYTFSNKKTGDTIVYPPLVEVFYDLGRTEEHRAYWYKRGINDLTIDKYQLGWYNGYNTIPIYMDGMFRNFQLRRDIPEKRIKGYYKNIGPLMYNSEILNFVSAVYIAEGLTDCLRLNQEGVPCVSHNTGSGGWMDEWFRYFIKVKEIYVVFDNDTAGEKGAKKVAKNLGIYRTKVFTFPGAEEKYDIVDFFKDGGTKEQFTDMVKSESKYLFELG